MTCDPSNDKTSDQTTVPLYDETVFSSPELIDEQRLLLRAERLEAVTSTVQATRAVITRHAVLEKRVIEVELWHEELVVEYIDGDGSTMYDGSTISEDGLDTIVVQLREEEIEIVKRLRVVEEVHITKRMVTEQQQISADLRHEILRIDEASS